MTLRFLFLLSFVAQATFGQQGQLVKVSGTKCSIVPPEGFTVATNFSGFQDVSTGASIMINEIPAPYETMVTSFTEKGLASKGMKLIDKKVIDFNNSKATFFNLSQLVNGTTFLKQLLVFGDPTVTVLVNGIYPEKSKAVEQDVKNALLSAVYKAGAQDNPVNAATFTIDVSGSDFKVVQYLSGSLIYTTDGKLPSEGAVLIAGNSISKVEPGDYKKYAEERMRKLSNGETITIKEGQEISIDDMKGYEIVGEGKNKDGKPELVYQVMLYSGKGDYFIVLGQTAEDMAKYLTIYRSIAQTFKRK